MSGNAHDDARRRAFAAERAVLGSVLRANDGAAALRVARDVLRGEGDFRWSEHRALYRALEACVDAGLALDMTTVCAKTDAPAHVVVAVLADGMDLAVTGANLRYHAGEVREWSIRRQVYAIGRRLSERASRPHADLGEIVASARFDLAAVGTQLGAHGPVRRTDTTDTTPRRWPPVAGREDQDATQRSGPAGSEST